MCQKLYNYSFSIKKNNICIKNTNFETVAKNKWETLFFEENVEACLGK